MLQKRVRRLIGLFLFGFLFIGGSFALHVVSNTATGTSSFGTVNEELSFLYNLTVNNTDTGGGANITQVNITLPVNFTFLADSANSSVSGYVLVNAGLVLSFTNESGLVMNSSRHFFWFNATALVPGNYNFTIATRNASSVSYANLSVSINDTTPPGPVSFAAPGTTSHSNLSTSSLALNVSVYDEGTRGTINITLYNYTYVQVINSTNSSAGAASLFVNFTNLTDGIYFVNVTASDINGNINTTVSPLRIALDGVAPVVALSKTAGNRTILNLTISISDAVTGVNGACTSVSGGGTLSGSGSTQYLYRTGLECGESYTFNVTCSDAASNAGIGSGTFSTDGCASSGSSGSGGGSGGSGGSSYWENTVSVSSSDFVEGHSFTLKEKERLRISVGGSDHHVGVVDIDSNDITINVSSTPQQAVLTINMTTLFEVTDDTYYDLSVTLNSINASRTGATITILSIRELTSAGVAALASLNSTSNQTTASSEGSLAGALFNERSWWIWLVFALILVVAVLILWKLYDRRQRLRGLKVSEESS